MSRTLFDKAPFQIESLSFCRRQPVKRLYRLAGISLFCFMSLMGQGAGQATAQDQAPFQDMVVNAVIDKKVQAELDLVPEQREELQKISKDLRKQRSEMAKELKTFSNSGVSERDIELRRRELTDQFDEQKQAVQTRVTELLLPHQVDRLKQVTVQLMLKQVSKKSKIASGVLAPQILAYLEVDEGQAKRIEDKAKELQERIAKELQRLTQEAREELMEELTSDQQEKYRALVGDPVNEKK